MAKLKIRELIFNNFFLAKSQNESLNLKPGRYESY